MPRIRNATSRSRPGEGAARSPGRRAEAVPPAEPSSRAPGSRHCCRHRSLSSPQMRPLLPLAACLQGPRAGSAAGRGPAVAEARVPRGRGRVSAGWPPAEPFLGAAWSACAPRPATPSRPPRLHGPRAVAAQLLVVG